MASNPEEQASIVSDLSKLAIGQHNPSGSGTVLPRYVYKPLGDTSGSFRLLQIQRRDNEALSLTLTEHSIAAAPEYLALSYTWGCPVNGADAATTKRYETPIEICCNGARLDIQRNLFEALCHFATSHPDAYFWADAICINQQDDGEKGTQVAQMGDIYANAVSVVVWLGLDTLYSKLDDFFWLQRADFREQLFELEEEGKTNQNPGRNTHTSLIEFITGQKVRNGLNPRSYWQAYEDFYGQARWWTRAWVVQEVALAQDIVMYCGARQIDWNRLRSLTNFINRHQATFSTVIEPYPPKQRLDLGWHGNAMYALRTLCINGGPEAVRSTPLGERFVFGDVQFTNPRKRLFGFMDYALTLVRPLRATKLQDKVFCLFGLLNRFLPTGMDPSSPDYKLSAESVYYSMASMLAEQGPTLSILSRVQDPALTVLETLPTWVPDFSTPNYVPRHVKEPPPTGKDSLFPYKDDVIWQSDADKDFFKQRCYANGRNLTLSGSLLDTVVDKVPMPGLCGGIATSAYIGGFLRLCKDMKIDHLGNQSRLEILSRTLTLNRADFDHTPPDGYMSSLQRFLVYFVALAHISSMRGDAGKGFMEIINGRLVENEAHKSMLAMLIDLQHLATVAPKDWRDVNEMQRELAPAFRKPEETDWMWTDKPREHPPFFLERASGSSLSMMTAIYEAGTSYRTLFLTRRGYLGLGSPSLEIGDEIWALSGAAVPFGLRQFETQHGILGEVYLHGFMDGWELMKSEGINDDLVKIVLT